MEEINVKERKSEKCDDHEIVMKNSQKVKSQYNTYYNK